MTAARAFLRTECQLSWRGETCTSPVVLRVAGVGICRVHGNRLEAMVADATARGLVQPVDPTAPVLPILPRSAILAPLLR